MHNVFYIAADHRHLFEYATELWLALSIIPVRIAGQHDLAGIMDDTLSVICRWKATALRQGDWESWFREQMKWANKKPEKGLYISLRMDGRVRGSGVGAPPWERMSVSLPPVSGDLPDLRCMSSGHCRPPWHSRWQ